MNHALIERVAEAIWIAEAMPVPVKPWRDISDDRVQNYYRRMARRHIAAHEAMYGAMPGQGTIAP